MMRLFEEGIKEGEETLSVNSKDCNESTKYGEKFSKDFSTCIKIVENEQTNNHSKHTEIYVKTRKEKPMGEREILL